MKEFIKKILGVVILFLLAANIVFWTFELIKIKVA